MTGAVRFVSTPGLPDEFTAFVGDSEVRVRFRRTTRPGATQWRCDECGAHPFTTCQHEKAAARARRENKENQR